MFFKCNLFNVGPAADTLNGGYRRRTSALPGPFSDLSRSYVKVFSFLSESTTYTGDMDLRDFNLATLFRIMNYSREILIEDDLFNRIEEFLRNILTANTAEEILNFLERIEGSSNVILSKKKFGEISSVDGRVPTRQFEGAGPSLRLAPLPSYC